MSFSARADSNAPNQTFKQSVIDGQRQDARSARPRGHLIFLLLTTFLLLTAGLMRMLPLLPDVDEGTFVNAALQVAVTGRWNPGFFGHPGGTLIYPLAAATRAWFTVTQGGSLGADPRLAEHFAAHAWEYYYLARLLSVSFCVVAVALVALVGRRAWGAWRVGVAAAWMTAFNLSLVYHAKMARTDAPGLAFAMLACWLALDLLENPGVREHLAAGFAAGLAAGTRYFIGAVGIVMVAASLLAAREQGRGYRRAWALIGAGAFAALAGLLLANPAIPFNVGGMLEDLQREARTTHLGADGLSPAGNFWWYLGEGLPVAAGLPLAAAVLGLATTGLEQRWGLDRRRPWLLLLFAATFVALISLPGLHWHRWLIPVLPVVMLFAAAALNFIVNGLAPRARWSRAEVRLIFGLALAALMATSVVTAVQRDIQDAGDNTRLLARAWMLTNLPAGSRILQEAYGAPLAGTVLAEETGRALAQEVTDADLATGSLASLRERGYDYVVAGSLIYDRFFAEPERYPAEIAFYEQLFAQGSLVQEFVPRWYQSGPTLRVYQP